MTDFPPPHGYTGYESRPYDENDPDERYVRVCTEEEVELLDGDEARQRAAERAEDEALRDAWFEMLREEQDAARHPGLDPGPSDIDDSSFPRTREPSETDDSSFPRKREPS